MLEKFIRACFGKPLIVFIVVVTGAVVGTSSFLGLRRDVFPDLSTPIFNIIVQNASMSAEELETAIAIPLEAALAGLPDVRRVRSTSQLGVAQVTIEFDADADYYRARQVVAERVGDVTSRLPPGTDTPVLSGLTGRLNEIFEFTLEAEPGVADLMTLRDLAEFDVTNRLLAVPGVAAVERLGGYLREFQVQIDPDRMSARGVSLDEVLHAVEGSNENASGGFVAQGPTEWTVRAVGRASTVEEIASTVVSVRAGTPVVLSDISDVREGPAVRRGLAHRLSGEVISCRVSKQFGADTVVVAEGVRKAIEGVNAGLPKGVHLRIVYDQSMLVSESLSGVGRAVFVGAIFVVLVIMLLLGNIRAALIVTATIPLSILVGAILLDRFDVGLNTMTLGGLAIAVGLLVDSSIIMVENIVHRLSAMASNAASTKDRAQSAAVEVGRPILFATLIIAAVFLPLFSMTGIEGRMYAPLALAVIASMGAALLLALTVTPVVAGAWLRPKAGPDEEVRVVRAVKRVYARALDQALARPGRAGIATAIVTVPVLGLAFAIGSDFMPQLDEGAFLMQTNLPAEASLDEVDRLNHRVEDVLRTFPEVEDVVRRTGRAERTEDPMPHTLSDVLIVLKKDRARSLEELEEAMREKVEKVPGVSALFTTPLGMRIDEGLGGTPADLSVRIFGPDLDRLSELGERAEALMGHIDGVEDLRVERLTGLPQLRIDVDRAAAARVGLTPGDVIRAVRVGLVGQEMSEVWIGQRRFDLVVRLQDHRRGDIEAIKNLLVDGHDGTRIALGHLARIEEVFAPGSVRREGGSRRIAIEAGVSGRDLAGVAADVQAMLAKDLELPAGYFFDVGGKVESQQRASRALALSAVLAAVLVFVLLLLALGSLAETLVIVATLPSAVVGGVLALLVSGETWNVSSLVGLIGLLGIAVQNALVLVTQVRALGNEGKPFDVALREAAIGRVRPKLMTAGTAILGLLPLLVLRLPGTEIERPLAVVMVGGLVTSTLFTLLALPAFYTLVERLQHRSTSER